MTDKTLVLDEVPGTRAAADMDTFVDACLVLAAQAHAAGLAGQITMRDGDSGRMHAGAQRARAAQHAAPAAACATGAGAGCCA